MKIIIYVTWGKELCQNVGGWVLYLTSYLTLATESSKQNYNISACETSCEKQKGVDLSTPHFRCLNEGEKLSWALPQRETWLRF